MIWPFSLFRKQNPVNPNIVALLGGGTVAYTPKNYESLSKAGYQACPIVYSCVKLIANTASRIPWYLQRLDSQGNAIEIEQHPLLDLINRPNESESGPQFMEKTLSHLFLAGNAYILKVSGTPSAAPSFLYSLRPDRVQVIQDKSGAMLVSGYRYRAAYAQDFPATDVLHLREFHPTEDFYGLSRVEVAAVSVDTMNFSAEWNASRLKKDMRPPGMLKAKSRWDIEKLKTMFRENYQGSENAGMPLVFSGDDIEWQNMSISPKDADWLEGQLFTLRQICSIFGVDPCLVGDAEYATLANKQEARKGLYNEVILPLMDIMRDEYQRWLVPMFGKGSGLQLEYDRDSIQELQEDVEKRNRALKDATWMTVNEKRLACGLEERPEGDELDKPAPPQLFGQPAPAPAQEPPPSPPPAKMARKTKWREPEQGKALWEAFEARARKRSATFAELALAYQKAQAARFSDKAEAYASLSSIRMEEAFNVHDEADIYVRHFWSWYADHYARAIQAGIRASKGEVFDDAEVKASWTITLTPAQEEKLQRMVFNSGTRVNETTIDVIYEQLKKAQAENQTVAEFGRNIVDKTDELSRGRAELWASTESCAVDNCGQLDGFKETDLVSGKGWLCSFLPTSRDSHEEVSGTEVGLDDAFNVGGSMLQFPGDPAGEVGEVANCRCTIYPVSEG